MNNTPATNTRANRCLSHEPKTHSSPPLPFLPAQQAAQAIQSSPPAAPPRPRTVRLPRTGPGLSLILHSRARLCCSCRPMRARDTSTTAFPLHALQATKLLKRCSHLHLILRPLLHLALGPYAHREQDLVSLILHSHGRAFVAHVVPSAQEIQVQRPFPYVHSRLPLGEFSHFAP